MPPGLAGLHPAYFALAMATGIVSLACQVCGLGTLALALFVLNLVFYAGLWALNLARLVRYPAEVRRDLFHHGRSVGFFTVVAATSVVGSQCVIVGGSATAGLVLWLVALVLWPAITYGVLAILTVKPEKPTIAEGLHGGWLLAVVAAQSIAVLGAQLAPTIGERAEVMLLFCLCAWLAGGMLYFWIISLIFYRYTFFTMSPSDLAPPYWINMGAAAISTLAGAMLVRTANESPVVLDVLPFVRGMTLMWWATATFWIPMLIVLGVWRHLIRRFPLRYDPLYWGAVFPLGMYTVCTARLSEAVSAPYLMTISRVFVYAALAAWCLAALGLARSFVPRNSAA